MYNRLIDNIKRKRWIMRIKYIWLVVAIIWCIAIFMATASPQATGSNTQSILMDWFNLSKEQSESINYFFRKSVHLGSFGLLSFLLYFAFDAKRPLLAWILTTIYAGTDEFHQSFVPNRTASFTDVIIDSVGAVIGIGIAVICMKIYQMKKRKRVVG